MTGFLLSPSAQADLDGIWDYSVAQWGQDQAIRYVLGIRDACQSLVAGTRQGRPIDDIRPGYWKLPVGYHVLFYRVMDTGVIDVVRILHSRMDAPAHL